ncbi:hypothetical protein MTO96_006875 [Rhipicephalus appendiculatus]
MASVGGGSPQVLRRPLCTKGTPGGVHLQHRCSMVCPIYEQQGAAYRTARCARPAAPGSVRCIHLTYASFRTATRQRPAQRTRKTLPFGAERPKIVRSAFLQFVNAKLLH